MYTNTVMTHILITKRFDSDSILIISVAQGLSHVVFLSLVVLVLVVEATCIQQKLRPSLDNYF